MSLESETVTNLRSYYMELLAFQKENKVEHVIKDGSTKANKMGVKAMYYEMSYRITFAIDREITELERILTVIDKL